MGSLRLYILDSWIVFIRDTIFEPNVNLSPRKNTLILSAYKAKAR